MIDPKTAPDPQIGSNPELLALCQEHIDECLRLRDRLREREETVTRQRAALQSLGRQLEDMRTDNEDAAIVYNWRTFARLAEEARDACAD